MEGEITMIQAINTTATALTAGQLVPITQKIRKGCTATLNSNTISLNSKGTYMVAVNADYTTTAAGDTTLQLLNNGVAIPDAKSTATGTAGGTVTQSFTTLIQVLCPALPVNLTLTESAAGTLVNASVVVTKVC